MSLPQFDVQGSLFESLGAIAPELFSDNDKYKRFAQKVWPVLAQSREQLLECYQADNGRPWSRAGGVTRGDDFPVFGTGARPAGGRACEVSFGLETGVKLEVERRRFSSDDLGLFSSTIDRTRQG
jgi:hypothetical protein